MSPTELRVLLVLDRITASDGEACSGFAPIMEHTGLDRTAVRRSCRSLTRKGFAQFYRGLWTDEGTPAGSGYCISPIGRAAADKERANA